MFKATRLAAPMLLAALVLSQAAPVLAAPVADEPIIEHEVVEDTVTWFMPAGRCPHLPADLSITGTGDHVSTLDIITYDDGRFYFTWDDTVTGTAVGSDGTAYTFYSNNRWIAYAPNADADVQFREHDLFLLQSPAAAANNTYVLRNSLDWRWTIEADALPFDVWPPADLQKTTDYGDPINADLEFVCDPL